MTPVPSVSVGLVTWNSAEHLLATLTALRQQSHPLLELIVVDNASRDHSLELVTKIFPEARIIRNKANTGFCQAHNQAIRTARGAYYLPLNPDAVLGADYIAALVEALEARPDYGMAGGKLLLPGTPARIDTTGLFINRRRQQYIRGHGEEDHGQYDQPGEVFGLDGAAPLYRKAMLEDIAVNGEYFDEAFFAHKEDVDLAWRARILGWKAWYTPAATAIHERSFRPGKRERVGAETRFHAVKNRHLLLMKNETTAGWKRDGLSIRWYDFQIFVYILLFERTSLTALLAAQKLKPRAEQWRKIIWSKARTSPADLLAWMR